MNNDSEVSSGDVEHLLARSSRLAFELRHLYQVSAAIPADFTWDLANSLRERDSLCLKCEQIILFFKV